MDTLYYCGFNGFQQVPAAAVSGQNGPGHTLTSLTPHGRHSKCGGVVDVAVCWNYLVVADEHGCVTKYGLVNGGRQNGTKRLEAPVKGAKIRQLSATPRHLLVCTDDGGMCGFYKIVRHTVQGDPSARGLGYVDSVPSQDNFQMRRN